LLELTLNSKTRTCYCGLLWLTLQQRRSQKFCSGGTSHWHHQTSIFGYFAQRSFWCSAQFLVYYNRILHEVHCRPDTTRCEYGPRFHNWFAAIQYF